MSSIAAITEAVRTALEGFGGIPSTPVRTYQPVMALEKIGDGETLIQVVPQSDEATLIGRGPSSQRDYRVAVAVSRRVNDSNAQRDAVITLADYLMAYMKGLSIGFSLVSWIGVEQEGAYVQEHLDKYGVLTVVFTLVYRTIDSNF